MSQLGLIIAGFPLLVLCGTAIRLKVGSIRFSLWPQYSILLSTIQSQLQDAFRGFMTNHHVGQLWPVGVFGRAHVHPCGGAAFPVAEEHMDGATGSSEGQRTAVLREREREGQRQKGQGTILISTTKRMHCWQTTAASHRTLVTNRDYPLLAFLSLEGAIKALQIFNVPRAQSRWQRCLRLRSKLVAWRNLPATSHADRVCEVICSGLLAGFSSMWTWSRDGAA